MLKRRVVDIAALLNGGRKSSLAYWLTAHWIFVVFFSPHSCFVLSYIYLFLLGDLLTVLCSLQ